MKVGAGDRQVISLHGGGTVQRPTARNDDGTRWSAASHSALWALRALSTTQNFEEITEELGVRPLSVKNSNTEFHDNTPNTLAADTRSVTDGRTHGGGVQKRRSNFLLRQESLQCEKKVTTVNVKN